MIEVTIKKIHAGQLRVRKALEGARLSVRDLGETEDRFCTRHSFVINCVLRLPKGSRLRKEAYAGRYIYGAELEDIVVDEFEID